MNNKPHKNSLKSIQQNRDFFHSLIFIKDNSFFYICTMLRGLDKEAFINNSVKSVSRIKTRKILSRYRLQSTYKNENRQYNVLVGHARVLRCE